MQSLSLALPEGGHSRGVPPEEVRFLLDVTVASLASLEQILDTSAVFSGLGKAREGEPVLVEDLFSDLTRFQRYFRALARAELVTEAEPGLPPVRASHSAMGQALLAVVLNAAEAGEGSRRVHVRAAAEGSGIRIVVQDDGPGIAPGDRQRVFDPFWTGKGEDHRGLGLTVARLVLAEHGGSVTIEDADKGPWSGGRVVLTVPVWD